MSSIRKGTKGLILSNVQTPNGMLYKGTKVKVQEIISDDKVCVQDEAGRVLWVKIANISVY